MGAEAISMDRLAMTGALRQQTPTKLQRPVWQRHSINLASTPGMATGTHDARRVDLRQPHFRAPDGDDAVAYQGRRLRLVDPGLG